MEERFAPEGIGSTTGWDKSKDSAPSPPQPLGCWNQVQINVSLMPGRALIQESPPTPSGSCVAAEHPISDHSSTARWLHPKQVGGD